MRTWKLEDAKNRFSEVVRRALADEPQRVTRHGRDAVVVVSAEEYERLIGARSLFEFLRASPLADLQAEQELVIERDVDPGREIGL
jgi:prevent-host-death family protein